MTITHVHKHEPHFPGREEDRFEKRDSGTNPYELPEQCSYCGSISPQALLEILKAGNANIHLADMKYGWPHKFYVEFPNPKAGKDCVMCSCSLGLGREPTEQDRAMYTRWMKTERGWHGEKVDPAPKTANCKFYSIHLLECPDDVFRELASLISLSGVQFAKDEHGEMMYSVKAK